MHKTLLFACWNSEGSNASKYIVYYIIGLKKIDQSFIKAMVENKDDEAVVHSTIQLAHNLGLSVVAEGVETDSALKLLGELGCDVIQGYLISKPLPYVEFEKLLKD